MARISKDGSEARMRWRGAMARASTGFSADPKKASRDGAAPPLSPLQSGRTADVRAISESGAGLVLSLKVVNITLEKAG